MNTLQKAYFFAKKIHENEFRRDETTPYMEHVQKVVDVVSSRWIGQKNKVVAYLHDTVESGASIEQLIEEGFDNEIIEAVRLLTLDKTKSYEENIRQIKNSGNQLAIQVKIADNLSNLSDEPTDKQILKYAKSLQILLE